VPFIRTVKIPSSGDGVLYLPVDTFGEVYMQGDHWHPNADGYDRIAQALTREIVNLH
jgi:lysophospholipase L1-like esterase